MPGPSLAPPITTATLLLLPLLVEFTEGFLLAGTEYALGPTIPKFISETLSFSLQLLSHGSALKDEDGGIGVLPRFSDQTTIPLPYLPSSNPYTTFSKHTKGLSLDFGTPVNTALLVYILYSVKRIIFPSTSKPTTVPNEFKAGYSWMPKTHPPTVLFKTFTPQTLEPFSGKDGGRILLAINGIVFDVTAGRNFYGPNGMYGNFAGRDASRGMAKQSFDLEMLTPIDQPLDKLEDLQSDEIENMKGWIDYFSNKYIVCGKLVENGQA